MSCSGIFRLCHLIFCGASSSFSCYRNEFHLFIYKSLSLSLSEKTIPPKTLSTVSMRKKQNFQLIIKILRSIKVIIIGYYDLFLKSNPNLLENITELTKISHCSGLDGFSPLRHVTDGKKKKM